MKRFTSKFITSLFKYFKSKIMANIKVFKKFAQCLLLATCINAKIVDTFSRY